MTSGSKLFDLLPALYRVRDTQVAAAQQTALGPLASLLSLIEEQIAVVANDLDQLYDDQFIETCAPWVIPYIGELIGYQPVHGVAPAVASPRAEVAHTISFRRRKGTVLVLEQLGRDVTGWGAHAVEFFKRLECTQYMKHIRPHNHYSPDLRNWRVQTYMDGAFDATAHSVDVRRIAIQRGRYDIQNIGIFLWSLGAYSLTLAPAAPCASNKSGQPQCFRFGPLGQDIPLFNNPVSQGSQIAAAARPVNVPDRLLRRVLCQDLRSGAGAMYYGQGSSLLILINGSFVNPYQIAVCNLSGADGSWANLPAPNGPYVAAIDPELGRIALASTTPGAPPQVSFYYGFNAALGGGEYAREQSFVVQNEAQVLPFPDTVSPARYTTLQDAVNYAVAQLGTSGEIALQLEGSGAAQPAYQLPGTLSVNVPAGTAFELRGGDGAWPMLLLKGEISLSGGAGSSIVLSGLLISSSVAPGNPPIALVHVPAITPDGNANQLGSLAINDCTLVPGWALTTNGEPQYGAAAALVASPAGLQVSVQTSIVGATLTGEFVTAAFTNSILDATSRSSVAYAALDGSLGGGALALEGATVIGKVHASLLTLVSNSIVWAELAPGDSFSAPLVADRKQAGCVRFSYLPASSIVPRQFECIFQEEGAPQPLFYSLRYGDPGYAKLLPCTDSTIRQGADDSGEMGAFHFLLAPQRETDLRVRMQEYLPVGLEFGIFYET